MIHEDQGIQLGPLELIVIQPTSYCNINCEYCYLPERASQRRMPPDLIQPVLEFALLNDYLGDVAHVIWHAGEPLTVSRRFYEQAFDCAARIAENRKYSKLRLQHSIQTNGMLLDQSWCDLFLRYSVHVGISLDGPRVIHDARRKTRSGTGTYDSVIRGLELVRQNKIPFSVITVLSNDVLEEPDSLFHFYKNHGIENVAFNIDEVTGINKQSRIVQTCDERLYRKFLMKMLELTADSGIRIRDFREYIRRILLPERCSRNQLTSPLSTLCIDCEGNFSLFCPELLTTTSDTYPQGFTLGNVRGDSLEAAIRGPEFIRMYREIQAGVNKCSITCEYFSLCGGGAPSNKLFENGTFDSTETAFCRFSRKAVIDATMAWLDQRLPKM